MCATDTQTHTRVHSGTRFPKFSDALLAVYDSFEWSLPPCSSPSPQPPFLPPPPPTAAAVLRTHRHTHTHTSHRYKYEYGGGLVKDWNSQSQMVRSVRLGRMAAVDGGREKGFGEDKVGQRLEAGGWGAEKDDEEEGIRFWRM